MADVSRCLQLVQHALESVTSGSGNLEDPLPAAMLSGIKTAQEILPIVKNFSSFKNLFSYLTTSNKCSTGMAAQLMEDTNLASFLQPEMINIVRNGLTSVQTCSSKILDILYKNMHWIGNKLAAVTSILENVQSWLEYNVLSARLVSHTIANTKSETATSQKELDEIRARLKEIAAEILKIHGFTTELTPDLSDDRFQGIQVEVNIIKCEITEELLEIQEKLANMEATINNRIETLKDAKSRTTGAATVHAIATGVSFVAMATVASPLAAAIWLTSSFVNAGAGSIMFGMGMDAAALLQENQAQLDEVNDLKSQVVCLQKQLTALCKEFYKILRDVRRQRQSSNSN